MRDKLFEAIEQGNLDDVRKLIKAGVDVNFANNKGQSPLMIAVEQESLDVVHELIKAKADVNYVDKNGLTPLVEPVQYGQLDLVKALINAGANVNYFKCYFEGLFGSIWCFSLLSVAKSYDRLEVLKELNAAGADDKILEEKMIQQKEMFVLTKLIGNAFEFKDINWFDFMLEGSPIHGYGDIFYRYLFDITKAFLENEENVDKKHILSALESSVSYHSKPISFNPFITEIDRISKSDETIIIHGLVPRHAIDIIFSNNYLILCNKGLRPYGARQIQAYKINRQAANIEQILKDLDSLFQSDRMSFLYDELPKAFQGEKDWICKALSSLIIDDQEVGNCGWESPKTGIEALIGLDYLLEHQNLAGEEFSEIIEELDRDVHGMMERWREFAKSYLFRKYDEIHRQHPDIEINQELYQRAAAALKS